jgi:hypothetical protein
MSFTDADLLKKPTKQRAKCKFFSVVFNACQKGGKAFCCLVPDGSQGMEKSASAVLPAPHPVNIFSCLLVAGFQPKSFFKLPQRLVKLAEPGLHDAQIQMRQAHWPA